MHDTMMVLCVPRLKGERRCYCFGVAYICKGEPVIDKVDETAHGYGKYEHNERRHNVRVDFDRAETLDVDGNQYDETDGQQDEHKLACHEEVDFPACHS